MKLLLLLFLIFEYSPKPAIAERSDIDKRLLKLMSSNKLKKFVRLAGSEENAIDKLMQFSVPDTFTNVDNDLVWLKAPTGSFVNLEVYASRKMQAYHWICRIYNSDYEYARGKSDRAYFVDEKGDSLWDYQDLDVAKKTYYYTVIICAPTNHRNYFEKLGYVKVDNKSCQELAQDFQSWHQKMKNNHLQYMRDNKIPPAEASRYKYASSQVSSPSKSLGDH